MGDPEIVCRDCAIECDERHEILCFLEDKFLWSDNYDLRRRLVRAIYAYEADLDSSIFKNEFMSIEDEIELVEIKSIISEQYRKELISMVTI